MRKKTVVLEGRPISDGVAVGRAEVRLEDPSVVPVYRLGDDQEVEAEIAMFHRALEKADSEAEADVEWARGNLPESEAEIFSAQRAILRDPALAEWVDEKIRRDRVNAGAAVRHRFDEFRAILGESTSEIIRNRILDVSDAERLILSHVLGKPGRGPDEALTADAEDGPVVLVTNNPPPSLLARIDADRVVGVLCEEGAGMSHVAVLARALNLPALIQVEGLLAETRDGDMIAIDAEAGRVTINPAPGELKRSQQRVQQRRFLLPPQPTDPRALRKTADGRRIYLLGNVTSQREVDAAAEVDADGIGLYRTEFLYLSKKRFPTETELVSLYSAAAASFAKDPVDIRLLDLGSDKHLPGASRPQERNPALGLRSMRFLFENPEILRLQIRAVLQASADGPARVLLPMVSDPGEIVRVREMVAECHEDLRREGIRHDPDLQVGAMIEHPAGVLMAHEIFREADFVSVGTNDLTMYILAVDREASHLTGYYDPFHPALLRVLHQLAEAGREAGKPVSLCGEIASDPTLTGLLIGLGITRLSMTPQWIVPVSHVLARIDSGEWEGIAAEARGLPCADRIRSLVRERQTVA